MKEPTATPQSEAGRIAHQIADCERDTSTAYMSNAELIASALRAAEARGKVQGLREAAEEIMARARHDDDLVSVGQRTAAYYIRDKADQIEQEQPK